MQKILKIAKNLKKGSIWLHLAYFLQKNFLYFIKKPKLQYIISKYLFKKSSQNGADNGIGRETK